MRIVERVGRPAAALALLLLAGAGSALDAARVDVFMLPPTLSSSAARQVGAAEDPVAMVVRVRGAVRVERAAGGAPAPASIGMRLMAGDRLDLADGAQAVLLYVTGRRQTLTESLTIAAPEAAERAGVFERTVSTLNAVASTDARQHPNRQGMIRPVAGASTLVSPRNDIKVMDLRPTFVWSAVPGATGYTIQLRSGDGVTRKRFDAGSDTVWTMPVSAPPLAPGARYHWTVAPAGNGRAAEEMTFRTLSASEYGAIEQGMAELRRAQLDPWSDGLFLAALVFRDEGLFYEADRALRQLESDAAVGQAYYLLRGEVYDALGLLELAAEAFDRAGETL